MNRLCWQVTADGRYRIGIAVGGVATRLMLDTGLVDPKDRVGIELESFFFDRLKQAGLLSNVRPQSRRDASGRYTNQEVAEATAQLIDPATGTRVGPLARIDIMRNPWNVPARVGVVFFHRLTGCRVDWDLDKRLWCVEYP
jgi:hypothetical protein